MGRTLCRAAGPAARRADPAVLDAAAGRRGRAGRVGGAGPESGAAGGEPAAEAASESRPEAARVVDHIGTWARRTPDAIAVQDDSGRITYAELEAHSDAVARTLLAEGLPPQSIVGVFVKRGRDLPIAAAAAHKARLAYAPIDPAEPAERLATMLDGVDFVLCSESTRERVPAGTAPAVTVDEAVRLGQDLTTALPADGDQADLAYVIYTSGSTGTPKGVMIEQGGLAAHIRWSTAELPLPSGSLVPCTASQSFDVSVWEMWRVLAAGATCLLSTVRLTPEEVVRLLTTHRVTHCYLPTPLAMHLLTHHHDAVPDLKWLGAGGDRLELPVGTRLPFTLTNLYGPAEATIWATAYTVPAGTLIGEDLAVPPIGRPLAGTEVVVVDDAGRPAPTGVPGELLIGGRCVGRGYHRSPERTAERFVTRAGLGGGTVRYYRTGDLARWNPDGELEFLGRLDRQVKVRGYRIELSEIEAALRAKTAVKDCAVIAERRQRSGVADMELVAFVVQSAEQELDVRSLRAALKDRLPGYMIPAVFVTVDEIPLTVNGKVDVAALARGTRRRLRVQEAQTVAPRDEIERTVADIWAQALGVESVGVHDNFFDLGGHSLMVTQLINRLDQGLGIRLSIREVYEAPTVAEMKTALVERVAAEQAGS
ncbi:amino acid adenylation domain-containing protein [Catenulispora yoronensis]